MCAREGKSATLSDAMLYIALVRIWKKRKPEARVILADAARFWLSAAGCRWTLGSLADLLVGDKPLSFSPNPPSLNL